MLFSRYKLMEIFRFKGGLSWSCYRFCFFFFLVCCMCIFVRLFCIFYHYSFRIATKYNTNESDDLFFFVQVNKNSCFNERPFCYFALVAFFSSHSLRSRKKRHFCESFFTFFHTFFFEAIKSKMINDPRGLQDSTKKTQIKIINQRTSNSKKPTSVINTHHLRTCNRRLSQQ